MLVIIVELATNLKARVIIDVLKTFNKLYKVYLQPPRIYNK